MRMHTDSAVSVTNYAPRPTVIHSLDTYSIAWYIREYFKFFHGSCKLEKIKSKIKSVLLNVKKKNGRKLVLAKNDYLCQLFSLLLILFG